MDIGKELRVIDVEQPQSEPLEIERIDAERPVITPADSEKTNVKP